MPGSGGALLGEHERSRNALTLLTMKPSDPAMYGRIVRDDDASRCGDTW